MVLTVSALIGSTVSARYSVKQDGRQFPTESTAIDADMPVRYLIVIITVTALLLEA